MGRPVKPEFQINNEYILRVIVLHGRYLHEKKKKKKILCVRETQINWKPAFFFENLATLLRGLVLSRVWGVGMRLRFPICKMGGVWRRGEFCGER